MKTQENLIEAAILLLNENASCSLDVIADNAGVTRRTLHRHFSTKDDLIKASIEFITTNMLTDLKQVMATIADHLEQLRVLFEDDIKKGRHYEFCQKFAEQYMSETTAASFKEMGDLFFSLLDELKQQGHINQQLSNEWLAHIWMGMVRSANEALKEGVIPAKMANDLAWNAFAGGVINQG